MPFLKKTNRGKKSWLLQALLIFLLCFFSHESQAFFCEPPTVEQAYKENDVVFIGRVISAKVAPTENMRHLILPVSILKLLFLGTYSGNRYASTTCQ